MSSVVIFAQSAVSSTNGLVRFSIVESLSIVMYVRVSRHYNTKGAYYLRLFARRFIARKFMFMESSSILEKDLCFAIAAVGKVGLE